MENESDCGQMPWQHVCFLETWNTCCCFHRTDISCLCHFHYHIFLIRDFLNVKNVLDSLKKEALWNTGLWIRLKCREVLLIWLSNKRLEHSRELRRRDSTDSYFIRSSGWFGVIAPFNGDSSPNYHFELRAWGFCFVLFVFSCFNAQFWTQLSFRHLNYLLKLEEQIPFIMTWEKLRIHLLPTDCKGNLKLDAWRCKHSYVDKY